MHALTAPSAVDTNDVVQPIVPAVMPVGPVRPGLILACLLLASATQAAQVVIDGPVGSGEFGRTVTTLPNGNIIVTDPGFDAPGPIAEVGAVHLYRPDGALISSLRGSSANDRIGSAGVVVLTNGNYVVRSPDWNHGAGFAAGAVTFGSGTQGVAGVVSASNSLVGATAGDRLGSAGVTALANGNYLVLSPGWDHGAIVDAGAVTFGSGTVGISGVADASNSLVGATADDQVGRAGVTALGNGNYVVRSPDWDHGAIVNAGAVTFGSGVTGISGAVSSANSLVGSSAFDIVGSSPVTVLANNNYAVANWLWDNGAVMNAGAVTFGSGTSGVSGVISASNSLVGSTEGDRVGSGFARALPNGNYVVISPDWDNAAIVNAGAVTFGSGTTGVSGEISSANSLVGASPSDRVGWPRITVLTNGNYVVCSDAWDNGALADVGAATFGSGTTGISGLISPENSLIGSTAGDSVASACAVALSNGNYVVSSPQWDDGAVINVGAVTFGSGTSGISGTVSPGNSLVGSTAFDQVGLFGANALGHGGYVVNSRFWDHGPIVDVGAITFGSGTGGITGVVSASNSLVGSTTGDGTGIPGLTALANGNYVVYHPEWDALAAADAGAVTFGSGTSGVVGVMSPIRSLVGSTTNDRVGSGVVTALATGDYVVASRFWDNGALVDAGAVTFGSGTSGISGPVTASNSLVGSAAGDMVGSAGVTALGNGHYVVASPAWDNAAIANAGAVTLGLADGSVAGAITSEHSVLGTVADQGSTHTFSYDAARNQLAVGQPASNRVVLHRTGIATTISIVGNTPDPSNGGEPVTFTATTTAAPSGPADGKVTFTASSGETCVDTTPMATSATAASWSCTLTFTASGVSTVIAEYTGSIIHAYSGSAPEPHTTTVESPLFANGFEGP